MRDPGAAELSARRIMEDFTVRTGLSPDGPQRRYLWTDAFALCNYLTLFGRTGDTRFRDLSLRLVDRVHHVLGRYRPDDSRGGWISELDEEEGERHPTAGGLRIGKELNERRPGEPYDPRSEWDRDGQYYHYLLKWVHALARAAEVLEKPHLHAWAIELAKVAHVGFTYPSGPGVAKGMYWKMSVDLTRPLVPSQGAHDPLDGFVACSALRTEDLRREIDELEPMIHPGEWVTDDSLGIGGLLTDAAWVAQLLGSQSSDPERLERLLTHLTHSSVVSLEAFVRTHAFMRPLAHRLAFRELGLAIGLRAWGSSFGSGTGPPAHLESAGARWLARHVHMADEITSTWLTPSARSASSWKAHEDINDVMLATALAPDEFVCV